MDEIKLSSEQNNFLNCFEKIQEERIDKTKNNLNVFMLKLNANDFDYSTLISELIEMVNTYVLSRKNYKEFIETKKYGQLSKNTREKFRKTESNEGELGELMLYAFLENHLKAPKIFSKMELKTSANDYVKGADGVHYLKIGENRYQLIFGEAKMYKDFLAGYKSAINSISEFEKNSKDNEKHYIISNNLAKEFNSEEEEEFIISLIYPSKDSSGIKVDDAYGIFIGFQIEVNIKEKDLDSEDFEKLIKNKINMVINKNKDEIINEIYNHDLNGHSFYIYVVPFFNIEDQRKRILGEILK